MNSNIQTDSRISHLITLYCPAVIRQLRINTTCIDDIYSPIELKCHNGIYFAHPDSIKSEELPHAYKHLSHNISFKDSGISYDLTKVIPNIKTTDVAQFIAMYDLYKKIKIVLPLDTSNEQAKMEKLIKFFMAPKGMLKSIQSNTIWQNLIIINLSENNIRSIQIKLLTEVCPLLREINLYGNKITHLTEADLITWLNNPIIIDLKNNNIRTIHYNLTNITIKNVNTMGWMKLHGNNMSEDTKKNLQNLLDYVSPKFYENELLARRGFIKAIMAMHTIFAFGLCRYQKNTFTACSILLSLYPHFYYYKSLVKFMCLGLKPSIDNHKHIQLGETWGEENLVPRLQLNNI